ncbi:MAG: response regulator [Planctomycetota bacterium]
MTDDDSAFRQVVCEGLSRHGFRVTEARDGQEALDVLESDRIHVALIDVHMPRVNGLEVIQRLSQRDHCPPCVLMSAQVDDEIRREAERWRAYRLLSKPVRLKELRQVICGALTDVYGWLPDRPS